jgi:hypothetical protein
MAKITAAGIFFRVPVVSQLDHRSLIFPGASLISGRCQEHQGETAFIAALSTDFNHSQKIAKEMKGLIQVTHPDHGVKILHAASLKTVLIVFPCGQFTVFWWYGCKNSRQPNSSAENPRSPAPGLAVPGTSAAAVIITDV